ncbi:MAG TPA: YbdK family carboxylate-amine ligase [Microbacteriaceae bacterium]|nr:YbdK family carboxylate-amine ligase [Microbacteriaceae bacterium]
MLETFGIEEEFILVDRRTLAPAQIAAGAIRRLGAQTQSGNVSCEFLPSQLEHSTRVCRDVFEAERCVLSFRNAIAEWADQHDVIAVPSGTPFQVSYEPLALPLARYEQIASDVGLIANEQFMNGMHVHIGISSAEEGVRVLNGLRPWLPALLALSTNSPFWAGLDSGHYSWRTIQTRRWTTSGIPPHFTDADDYQRVHDRMIGVGATQHYSKTNWAIRLSEPYPTVEVRVFDMQLTAREAVSIAAILRALANAAADGRLQNAPARTAVLDAELWHAARWGLTDGLYEPLSGTHAAAEYVLATLVRVIKPALERDGSFDYVRPFLREIELGVTGAVRQRASLAQGVPALGSLYRSSLVAA